VSAARRRLALSLVLAASAAAPPRLGATAAVIEDNSSLSFQSVVVKPGDTLWGIANRYLKDPRKWDEILRYNKLPSADPTVALPGLTLRVPVTLIKEDLRAAHLVHRSNRVDFRRKATADWTSALEGMELLKGDALRTFDDAHAKVKFLSAELLSVDPNSLVIIKPPRVDFDVELKSGSIFTGRSRVVTATARITPKTRDTQYSTRIEPDFTTKVAVHRGLAAVEAQGQTVDVKAGMATEIKMGMAPSAPTPIPDLPDFEARAAEFNGQPIHRAAVLANGSLVADGAAAEQLERAPDAAGLRGEVTSLRIGIPISGYRVQASLRQDFERVSFDKTFDAEERFDMRYEKLLPGVYWFRIALVDLLGTQEKWSAPRLFSMGGAKKAAAKIDLANAVLLAAPSKDDEQVSAPKYKVFGVIKIEGVAVSVNGKTVRADDYGNFSVELKLKEGPNDVNVIVSDDAGDSSTISRTVSYFK
jgi:hypothetical protein